MCPFAKKALTKEGFRHQPVSKWIYTIIIALVLGFGTYGYFTVKKWLRYAAIESSEKPITGTGGGNIVATILIGGVGVVIVVIILICMLIKYIRKKKE